MATTTSIVDYLNSTGKDSSLGARADLAVSNGLVSSRADYLNLAAAGKNGDINTQLLTKLQTPASTTTTTSTVPPASTTSSTYIPTASKNSVSSNSSSNPITTNQLSTVLNAPEPTSLVTPGANSTSFSDKVSSVASSTLNSNQLAVDDLRKQLQTINEAKIKTAEGNVAADTNAISGYVNTTQVQDALQAVNDKFHVEENIKLYSTISQRIVDAQEALNMGLIYEADRPARMKFVTGAESTLQKQGLATIGALQGTAAVIKGNIDMAKAYADSTISAINSDNETSFKALTTLLELDNSQLVSLTTEEKSLVNDRLSAIETQAAALQKNKDDVVDLMTKYPKAFLNGGVTLLDTKEQALAKMLPTMAVDEKAKFDSEIATKNKTNKTEAEIKVAKSQLLEGKARGMTYAEAVTAFGDTIDLSYIAAVYGRATTDTSTKTDLYSNFINPDGTPKEGYKIGLDTKGNPIIEKTNASGDTGVLGKIWSALFN